MKDYTVYVHPGSSYIGKFILTECVYSAIGTLWEPSLPLTLDLCKH